MLIIFFIWSSVFKKDSHVIKIATAATVHNRFSAQFSNAISSEVPGPIDFKFYVTHPGECLYQGYGNYADAAILSAELQGPWASCYLYMQVELY